jgi:hypothetical protein
MSCLKIQTLRADFWPEHLQLNEKGRCNNAQLIDELQKRKIPKRIEVTNYGIWVATPNCLLRDIATKLELESLELNLELLDEEHNIVTRELIDQGFVQAAPALQKMKMKEIIWTGWNTELFLALAHNPNITKVWSDFPQTHNPQFFALQCKMESFVTTKDTTSWIISKKQGIWPHLVALSVVYDSDTDKYPVDLDLLPVLLPKLESFLCAVQIEPLTGMWGLQMSQRLKNLTLSTPGVHQNAWHQRLSEKECEHRPLCHAVHDQFYSLQDEDLHLALTELRCLEELQLHNHWRLQCRFLPFVVLNNQNTLKVLSLRGCLIDDLTQCKKLQKLVCSKYWKWKIASGYNLHYLHF